MSEREQSDSGNNGLAESTGWVGADDCLLVDLNVNGQWAFSVREIDYLMFTPEEVSEKAAEEEKFIRNYNDYKQFFYNFFISPPQLWRWTEKNWLLMNLNGDILRKWHVEIMI